VDGDTGQLYWHGEPVQRVPESFRAATPNDFLDTLRSMFEGYAESLRRGVQATERQNIPRGQTGDAIRAILDVGQNHFEDAVISAFRELKRAVAVTAIDRLEALATISRATTSPLFVASGRPAARSEALPATIFSQDGWSTDWRSTGAGPV
jgi:hypothetical protein